MEKNKTGLLHDRYFWTILSISLIVRIYLSCFTYVIVNDSVAFTQNAYHFAHGDFGAGLRHDYHPLYSMIMAGVYKIVPNMELSGTLVSLFFGTFAVIVFYLMGKTIFDHKVSFVSAILLAFHPYAVRLSADIISESTYFFFFVSSLGLGFFAITRRQFFLFALTGSCSAFAYLTRPEGIGIVIIVTGWCFIKDLDKIRLLWKGKLASILILTVSFLAVSSPYLIFIKGETGKWLLTMKRNFSQTKIVKIPEDRDRNTLIEETVSKTYSAVNAHKKPVVNNANPNRSSEDFKHERSGAVKEGVANVKFVERPFERLTLKMYLESLVYVITKYISTFHPFLFIFLIIGVINWTRIKRARFFGYYITTVIAFYMIILYRLNLVNIAVFNDIDQYPSRRHVMPIIIPALFFVGIGVYATGTWMQRKFQSCSFIVGFKDLLKSTWAVQMIVLTIVICVLLPKTLKPQRLDKVGVKEMGQWLTEYSPKPNPSVLSASARNAYYAKGIHIQIERIDMALLEARSNNADYIFLSQREYVVIEERLKQALREKQIKLENTFPEEASSSNKTHFLYKVIY